MHLTTFNVYKIFFKDIIFVSIGGKTWKIIGLSNKQKNFLLCKNGILSRKGT